ncbi:ribosome maturation factor RimP [Euzebya sp.]|uniref:ribosome maturation factor RimP n=1 Tax=Euzebya sp. TaxID=1971409 RepID=UPI003515C3B3
MGPQTPGPAPSGPVVSSGADPSDTVDHLVRPLVEGRGLDLVDVAVKGGGSRTRVRVVVDRKGGVDLATCQDLSRELGRALDDEDPIAGRYTLEVTSPGTDWPLTDQRSFDRVEGRVVKAILRTGEDTTREVVGTVTGAGPTSAVLTDADGEDHDVAYDVILKATQELPW